MAAVQGRNDDKPKGRVVATYNYHNADGTLSFQVLRLEPKSFRQRRPDGNGGWIWKLDESRVVYRLPELLKFPDAAVFACEGEKDADRVASLGHCATTVAAGKWTEDCIKALAGRDCIILQDNDEPGAKKALKTAQALHDIAKSVRIVLLPNLPYKGDVSKWLDADPRRAEKLVNICFDVPLWEPNNNTNKEDDPGFHEMKDDAEEVKTADDDGAKKQEQKDQRIVQSSAEFTKNYIAPDYLIDGLLQRRYCYSLTARTGAGKTALVLLFAAHVGLGLPLGDRDVDRGRVLIFAGENPDDVRGRWIAMAQQMDFDIETINVHFMPGRFKITKLIERIRIEMEALGGASLLIIDTSAAYFEGDNENDNVQLGQHASQMRELRIPGGPCTIINCHPTKNAADDNLIPRGGGAFLNEVDGNLAARKDDMTVELHWQGKFRGPEFAPMNFVLKTVTHERLKDSKGRLIPTVIAACLTDQAQQDMAKASRGDENLLLKALNEDGNASISELAIKLGWLTARGDAQKSKVHRILGRLKKHKFVADERGHLTLTEKGHKALKTAYPEPKDSHDEEATA